MATLLPWKPIYSPYEGKVHDHKVFDICLSLPNKAKPPVHRSHLLAKIDWLKSTNFSTYVCFSLPSRTLRLGSPKKPVTDDGSRWAHVVCSSVFPCTGPVLCALNKRYTHLLTLTVEYSLRLDMDLPFIDIYSVLILDLNNFSLCRHIHYVIYKWAHILY